MKNHTLSKLAILAAAVVINGFELAGVNYLFSGDTQQRSDRVSLARAPGFHRAPRPDQDTFASVLTP
jgi:hypothetical protein